MPSGPAKVRSADEGVRASGVAWEAANPGGVGSKSLKIVIQMKWFWSGVLRLLLTGTALAVTLHPARAANAWTLVWADEFQQADGSVPDATKWGYDIGGSGWGNNELEYYTSRTNNARIEGGQLVIEARQESFGGKNYTSARLLTKGKWSGTYARIEARMKIPRGQGIWPAFWMLGTNITSVNWPTCGEIDIMENIGKEPCTVHGTIHGPGYSGGSGIGGPFNLPGNAEFAADFHVFAIEWETNRIRWFVDSQPFFTVTPTSLPTGTQWVFTQPQFLLLNLAVGGNWPGNPDGTTVFPQRLVVDYVRVYATTNRLACGGNSLTNPGFEFSGLVNWNVYGAGFNTALASATNNQPVPEGSNSFKVFGQFTGNQNYSGLYEDVPCVPGQSFTAGGRAFTPANDQIAGGNSAWIEVSFRDAAANLLSLYRTAAITPATPAGVWINLAVTNQFNPTNYSLIGPAPSLIAPVGTTFARYQVVFQQPGNDAGAVFFDDLNLGSPGATEIPVSAAASNPGGNLSLAFPTFLGQTSQVRFKSDLRDANWQVLTNVIGDGSKQIVSDAAGAARRFYQVACLCD